MRAAARLALVATTVLLPAGVPAFGQGRESSLGRRVYVEHCAICHGAEGDGRGHAAHHFATPPRDFTGGRYKIRSTASGQLPTDEDGRGDGPSAKDLKIKPSDLTRRPFKGGSTPRDIVRAVITGFDGTPMPSYHVLIDDGELWDLGRYVASLGGTPEVTRDEREGWHVVRMHQRRGPR